MNLFAPKAGVKLLLLLNKPASGALWSTQLPWTKGKPYRTRPRLKKLAQLIYPSISDEEFYLI
jgi:hypothetical protein